MRPTPANERMRMGLCTASVYGYNERVVRLAAAAQYNFLTNQAAHVQIFRQRIPIRNVDPSVYQ